MRRTLLALLCVSLLAPMPAHAYRASGDGLWREPVVTYSDHTAGAYGNAAAMAVAAWNATGMRLILVPAPSDRANIQIRSVPAGTQGLACVGVVGATGAPGDRRGNLIAAEVRVATGCRPRGLFQQITAHEIGHALGLGHENRRCSTMVSDNSIGARRCGSAWLKPCRVLQPDDIRGAVRFYGGRATSVTRTTRAACRDRSPADPGRLHVIADPPGTVATATLWTRGSGGRAIVVGRRKGACPASPIDRRGAFFYAAARAPLVPAFGGQASPGSWCYRLWRVSPGGRWSRPRTVIVRHGARTAASRIGLSVKAGVVRFKHPKAPAGWRLNVEAINGACTATPGRRRTIDFGPVAPGRADSATDPFPLAPGAVRCYRVVVHDGHYPILGPSFVATATYQGV
jgi:hypothetical protein